MEAERSDRNREQVTRCPSPQGTTERTGQVTLVACIELNIHIEFSIEPANRFALQWSTVCGVTLSEW